MYPVRFYKHFNGFEGDYFGYERRSPWYDDDYDGEILFYYGRELNGDVLFMTIKLIDYDKMDMYASKMDKRDVDIT